MPCAFIFRMTKKGRFRQFWDNLKETAKKFNEIDPFTHAGSLAYTTIFAMPGTIILVLTIAGIFYDANEVRDALYTQAGGFVGADTSRQLQRIVSQADQQQSGFIAKIIGIAALAISATTAFAALQKGLNKVWRIGPVKGKAILHYLGSRAVSLAIIAAFGFLLLMSLVLDAVLVAVSDRMGSWIPAEDVFFGILGALSSFAVVTLVFALVFKLLPDTKVPWREVWVGALFTAVLFTLGKFLIGLYVTKAGAVDAYGAGGVVVVLMLWAYFSSLILLFGAQYTYVSSGSPSPELSRAENKNEPAARTSPGQ